MMLPREYDGYQGSFPFRLFMRWFLFTFARSLGVTWEGNSPLVQSNRKPYRCSRSRLFRQFMRFVLELESQRRRQTRKDKSVTMLRLGLRRLRKKSCLSIKFWFAPESGDSEGVFLAHLPGWYKYLRWCGYVQQLITRAGMAQPFNMPLLHFFGTEVFVDSTVDLALLSSKPLWCDL